LTGAWARRKVSHRAKEKRRRILNKEQGILNEEVRKGSRHKEGKNLLERVQFGIFGSSL
jgi:hypothetical protein